MSLPAIKIEYNNIPTGSISGSTTSGNYQNSIVNYNDFKSIRDVPQYSTLEQGRNQLRQAFINVPNNPSGYGYISTIFTDEHKRFAQNIVITRTYDASYTAPGLSIEFDTYTNDYPETINVKWKRSGTVIEDQTYTVNSALYFCNTQVTAFDEVVITIGNMTKPYRLLKIFNIYDGIARDFYNEEIENLEIIECLNAQSEAIAINEANVDLIPNTNAGVMFQRTLPFRIYRNDVLYCYFFINTSTSNTYKTKFNVKVDDLINVIDTQSYLGGIYTNTTASTLIADILGDIPYNLETALGQKVINGYLPICSKREALSQVAFCIGAMIDTSRSEEIEIKSLPTSVSRTLLDSEIISVDTTQDSIVTNYTLNVTQFLKKRNVQNEDLFSGKLNGTQYITFDEPMYNLTADNCTISSYGDNWCIITNSNNNTATLTGKPYQKSIKTYTKTNPYVVTTDILKSEEYNTTLECDSNTLLNNMNFVRYRVKSKFLMSGSRVGDLVSINGMSARITTLNYNISQTNIYCEAELEAYYE